MFDSLIEDPPPYLKHYLSLKETYSNHHEIYKHHINFVKTKIRDLDAKGKSKYKLIVGSHYLPIETVNLLTILIQILLQIHLKQNG